MKKTYSITDLDGYAKVIRDNAAGGFTSEDFGADNPDDFISVGQVKSLIISTSLGKNNEDQYIINDEVYNNTYDTVCGMIFGVGLCKLASRGHIDVYYNSEIDQFEFTLTEQGAKEAKSIRSMSKKISAKKKKRTPKKKDIDKDPE